MRPRVRKRDPGEERFQIIGVELALVHQVVRDAVEIRARGYGDRVLVRDRPNRAPGSLAERAPVAVIDDQRGAAQRPLMTPVSGRPCRSRGVRRGSPPRWRSKSRASSPGMPWSAGVCISPSQTALTRSVTGAAADHPYHAWLRDEIEV